MKFENLYPEFAKENTMLNMMGKRLGDTSLPKYSTQGVDLNAAQLITRGGFPQQDRIIKDRRRTLDRAVLYSYQGALIKKHHPQYEPLIEGVREAPPVRALINPNKLKQDYDDKILSTGFENDFHPGDIFEWCNTGTYWLIYLQDLTELAYFRGDIRRCSYEVQWKDKNGDLKRTYIAVRGPVEDKINYIQKHGISVDTPNYSLSILMPENRDTIDYFKRYSKFYLQGLDEGETKTCWRVEAVNSISMQGVIELTAVEYYANEHEDDVQEGIVGAFVSQIQVPTESHIVGENFIKPKMWVTYEYSSTGTWVLDEKLPVEKEIFINEKGKNCIKIKWLPNYSGQFDLSIGGFTKTIVVQSLF